MPPPKDPQKYALYIQRQRESHLGKESGFKGKTFSPESLQLLRDSHRGQVSGFKGKKHDEQTLQKMREVKLGNNYRRGKKMTPEQIEYNRISHLGQVPWMKGRKHKPEAIQKNSESHMGNTYRRGQVHTPEAIAKIKEARSRQVFPLKDTRIEKIMQIALALNGIKFQKHKLFQSDGFFHQVDIFIEPNIVIECDGDYWHSLTHMILRDEEVDTNLKILNCVVNRFKETQIEKDVQVCVNYLVSNYPCIVKTNPVPG